MSLNNAIRFERIRRRVLARAPMKSCLTRAIAPPRIKHLWGVYKSGHLLRRIGDSILFRRRKCTLFERIYRRPLRPVPLARNGFQCVFGLRRESVGTGAGAASRLRWRQDTFCG
ncbi:hypothetical protein EVAR_47774_1 [Eumeta japonica]|uniref:Uncharacterized protein n=1 Tax=Eumeta variegata TaxID=151549 RepID=A0A4C1XVU8_EUMVA|nr:hypothetical protein EVAR_47774_1 [Eumeta japonica]